MPNINASLIIGHAQQWLRNQVQAGTINIPRPEYAINEIVLRVYDLDGTGFFFIRADASGRWYHDDDPDDGHFNRADMDALQKLIDAGGRVQIIGRRGEPYGTWRSWADFAAEVIK